MSKRKLGACPPPTLSCLDAALDFLACETFTRLDQLTAKFELVAGVNLKPGTVKARWEEAIRRYELVKSLDGLCCSLKANQEQDEPMSASENGYHRPLPDTAYLGVKTIHRLNEAELSEWKQWKPRLGDVVLVDLQGEGCWPGKIIDKRHIYSGRAPPRGNHFFPVRIYNERLAPTVTVKSHLLPFHLRPDPPLMASEDVLGAYNHAAHPEEFDAQATRREAASATDRACPTKSDEEGKAEKADWKKLVNWAMDQRRLEKLREIQIARMENLLQVTDGGTDIARCMDEVAAEERKEESSAKKRKQSEPDTEQSIFGPIQSNATPPLAPNSPAKTLAGYIRPALSSPQRPSSPRRPDKRRGVAIFGDGSPRSRGGTYTPPRVLPSGDETAPAPSRQQFDFASPLGPKGAAQSPRVRLEVVQEDPFEPDGGEWTLVSKGKGGKIKSESNAFVTVAPAVSLSMQS